MRLQRIVFLLGLCTLGSGCCTYWKYACRNLVEAPIDCLDDCLAKHRNRQWAKAAWNHVVRCEKGKDYSEDYEEGFLDGFADYLDNGGDKGVVPVMPPPRYRHVSHLSPDQYQAAEDWFTGFRHGVAVARGSGLRLWNTIPTSGEGLAGQMPRPQPAHPIEMTPPELAHPLPFPPANPTPEKIPVGPTPAPEPIPVSPKPATPPEAAPTKHLREQRGSIKTAPSAVTRGPDGPKPFWDGAYYGEPLSSPYHAMLQPPRPGWDLVALPSSGER
jgi:hypothetical protein